MIRLASSPEPNMKLLARSALTMLSSPTLMKASNSRLPEAGDAAFDALRDWARGEGDDIDTRPASSAEVLAALAPDRPLEIAIRDWDVLFRAVESRLLQGVGYQLESVPKSPASDAAESVQSIVVECVTALRQLHVALTQEREQRDPSRQVEAQSPGYR
jgi:hypothetical protein